MRDFNDAIDACHLRVLGWSGHKFMRADKQIGEEFIKERLDHFLCSIDWLLKFCNAWMKHISHCGSDHFPILANCNPLNRGRLSGRRWGHRFFFDNEWTKNE